MLYSLSQGQKTFADAALAIIGLAAGVFVSTAAQLPPPWNTLTPIIGTVVGYFVSDLTTFVNTGQAPISSQLIAQGANAYQKARPSIVASIAKLPAEQQVIANAILDTVDLEVAKVSGTAPAT